MCVIYGSQTGGGKKVGRGEKELLVVAEIGSRGKEEEKKDLLVVTRLGSRGSGSSEKRFVGGYPIRKSSRSDGSERCG